MMLLAVLFAAATPEPGALRTFGDWTVGCDNGRACQAVALVTYADETPRVTLTLRREAEVHPDPGVPAVVGDAAVHQPGAVEQQDLASGTSSKSSKLIHGGLRYLERLEFGLVREGLRERGLSDSMGPLWTTGLTGIWVATSAMSKLDATSATNGTTARPHSAS